MYSFPVQTSQLYVISDNPRYLECTANCILGFSQAYIAMAKNHYYLLKSTSKLKILFNKNHSAITAS